MPKLTVDGKEIEVPDGTKVIEAAKMANIDVPFYCYHPGLSIAGNCRMCLVEVEKMPKLQIACHMNATEGMVVNTQTERVKQTRKHVLEFLLVNHPVDCPVCDQAGECWLQDYYMNYGSYQSRLNENKIKKKKAQPIGEHVMLDNERCILCSRCVRFTDEISKSQELGIVNRGDHSEVALFPGMELNNAYSGNVVDICPVGALTDKDFRFKMRVWYLKSEDTLCNGCSRGCNISLQYSTGSRPHHAGGDRVIRLKPRFNAEINKWWMCDEGRYGYKFHDHNRITDPLRRQNSKVEEMTWDKILPELAERMKDAGHRIGVLASPQLSNEDLFVLNKLFKDEIKSEHIYLVSPNEAGYEDDFLIRADKNPNSKGAEFQGLSYDDAKVKALYAACEKGELDGLIIFGQDILSNPDVGAGRWAAHDEKGRVSDSPLQSLKWTAFIGSNHNIASEYATYVLPSATYIEEEGTFTNFEGRTQKFDRVINPLGESKPEWQILIDLAGHMGIHIHFDEAEEIFKELATHNESFKGLTYEAIRPKEPEMREMAMPMIPELEQDSALIFHKAEPNQKLKIVDEPEPAKEPQPS